MKTEEKMQYFNNTQINDWESSKRTALIDFTGKALEYIYFVRTEKEFNDLLNIKPTEKKKFQDIRKILKFSKIICRFFFGNYKPNLEQQKKLIDFQLDIFDELSVQLVKTQFQNFKQLYEYAKTKDIPISTVADVSLSLNNLKETCKYMIEIKPANTRWIQRKIDSYYQHYLVISRTLKNAGMDYYLVSCDKRCSIKVKDFNDIAIPIIARGHFEFKGCCFNYQQPPKQPKNKKPFFPDTMDQFDLSDYKYKKVKNKDYKRSRANDVDNLGKADVSKKAIDQRDSVKQLFQHLKGLEKQ